MDSTAVRHHPLEIGLRIKPPLIVAGLFVVTRCVALAGMLVASRGDLGNALRAAGSNFDSSWYQIVVSSGYAGSSPSLAKAGFYPGYPFLVSLVYQPLRALARWLDPAYVPAPELRPWSPYLGQDPLLVASLLIVANLSLVIALVALWRLYEPDLGATVTVIGCGLLLTAPSAFFLSSGFSESSFIAAVACAFLFAQRQRWVIAGLAGAVACLIRAPGLFVLLPLAITWWQLPRPRPLRSALTVMGLVGAGAALFPAYTWFTFGDPLFYVHLQAANWGHNLTNPLAGFATLVRRIRWGVLVLLHMRPSQVPFIGPKVQIVDGLMVVWAIMCGALAWLRLPLGQVVWIPLMVVYPLASGSFLLALNRYVLAAWPAFFITAWWLRRFPPAAAAIMLVDLAVMFLLARDHALGRLVG
jgi:hypothetical protein